MLRSGPARNSCNAIRADCKMKDSGHELFFFMQDEFIVAISADLWVATSMWILWRRFPIWGFISLSLN